MKALLFLFFLILRIVNPVQAATGSWGQPAQDLSMYQPPAPPPRATYQQQPQQQFHSSTQQQWLGVPVQPVTGQCLQYAARRFNIPIEALFLVLDIERGEVGKTSKNGNGTYDMGPMQINSCHIETFEKAGISRDMILYNGCVNILAGAYLLFGHAQGVGTNDWLEIIGRYHSRTPEKKARYQAAAIRRWNQMGDNAAFTILRRANGAE